jgi:tol-pal system protein YbgF
MKKLLCCAAVLLAVGCASSKPANDEADIVPPAQVAASQQTTALESRVDALQTSLTELLERLDVMNDRIARMEAAPAPASVVSAPVRTGEGAAAPPVPAPAPEPSRALVSAQLADTYRNALMLYGRGKMEEARRTFQQVFDQDPTGDLADNALYWIGETYYAANNYAEASKYYKRVTVEFSEQNKAPDALFKIALSFAKMSDLGMAKQTLEEVIRRYPYSSAAASAKLELKRIRY